MDRLTAFVPVSLERKERANERGSKILGCSCLVSGVCAR